MINFDDNINEIKTKHNKNWPFIWDNPYRILIIGGSVSTNLLLNLIENQPDIDKIYFYTKNPYESKYKYLINKKEDVGINHFNDPELLFIIQMIWMFIKILMITILRKKIKC